MKKLLICFLFVLAGCSDSEQDGTAKVSLANDCFAIGQALGVRAQIMTDRCFFQTESSGMYMLFNDQIPGAAKFLQLQKQIQQDNESFKRFKEDVQKRKKKFHIMEPIERRAHAN